MECDGRRESEKIGHASCAYGGDDAEVTYPGKKAEDAGEHAERFAVSDLKELGERHGPCLPVPIGYESRDSDEDQHENSEPTPPSKCKTGMTDHFEHGDKDYRAGLQLSSGYRE